MMRRIEILRKTLEGPRPPKSEKERCRNSRCLINRKRYFHSQTGERIPHKEQYADDSNTL